MSTQQTFRWAHEFANAKIHDSKSIKELLEHEGISLWWFIEPWLDYPLPSTYTVTEMLGKKKLAGPSLLGRIRFNILLHSFKLKALFRKIRVGRNRPRKSRLLFFNCISHCQGTQNARFGELIEKTRRKHSLALAYYDGTASWGRIARLNRSADSSMNTIEAFLDFGTALRIRRKARKYARLWRVMSGNEEFERTLKRFAGKNHKLLKRRLKYLFIKCVFDSIMLIELSRNAIKQTQPKAVLNGLGPNILGKANIVASMLSKVPNVQLQEGLMNRKLVYVHNKKDVDRLFPLPTVFLAYSNHEKQFLTKEGGYPERIIRIVGQPASDRIFRISRNQNKDKIFKELKLSKTKKTIVFASGTRHSKEEAQRIAKRLAETAKRSDAQIIIKQHPRDPHSETYDKVLTQNRIGRYLITKEHDLHKILSITDVLISVPSTVMLEGMMFNIPVILLSTSKLEGEFRRYADTGATLPVNTPDKLEGAVRKVLTDPNHRKKLSANMKRFVSDNVYKIDGHVNDRIVEVIKGIAGL